MKIKFNYIAVAIGMVAIALSGFLWRRLNGAYKELDAAKNNVEQLVTDVQHYKTESGKNAAKAGALYMDLQEYKRYRAEDAALIKQLKLKQKELASVGNIHTQTTMQIAGAVKDSVVYMPGDSITKVLRCVDYADEWVSVSGCADSNKFNGLISVRDSLLITETIKYKRFLFWRTNKVKERSVNVVCRNPHTQIKDVRYIIIRK